MHDHKDGGRCDKSVPQPICATGPIFFGQNQFTNQTCSDFIMSLSIQNTETGGEITLEV